jgi:hypothetical protein
MRRTATVILSTSLMFGGFVAPTPAWALDPGVVPSKPLAGTWGTNGTVYVTLVAGDRLYLGGTFSSLVSPDGSTKLSRKNLAALDAATGVPLDWHADTNGIVRAIVTDGTRVFVGGGFTTVNGVSRGRLAALDPVTGAADPTWTADADGVVRALALRDTSLYAGGAFLSVGGAPRSRLAAISTLDATVSAWSADADALVTSLTLTTDAVIAGGSFKAIRGDASQEGVARLDPATGDPLPWTDHSGAPILALDTGPDDMVVAAVGGTGGKVRAWSPFGDPFWTVTGDGDAQAVTVFNGRVVAGGHWSVFADVTAPRLVALDPLTGALDTTWKPSPNKQIWGLSSDDTRLLIGGAFTKISSTTRRGLALYG